MISSPLLFYGCRLPTARKGGKRGRRSRGASNRRLPRAFRSEAACRPPCQARRRTCTRRRTSRTDEGVPFVRAQALSDRLPPQKRRIVQSNARRHTTVMTRFEFNSLFLAKIENIRVLFWSALRLHRVACRVPSAPRACTSLYSVNLIAQRVLLDCFAYCVGVVWG